ncbi:hypothetical protein Pcinc_022621 [Petrolisthes cinctipes]|uniref:Uncharacterized protein n=1 Tax=Petrolisthes cinctipes TaxID=88211 RepID=A0AAE1KGV5_PETCI|nr:hypothetical protein Pcinc_022621 [Petrolisthes cinctipes]
MPDRILRCSDQDTNTLFRSLKVRLSFLATTAAANHRLLTTTTTNRRLHTTANNRLPTANYSIHIIFTTITANHRLLTTATTNHRLLTTNYSKHRLLTIAAANADTSPQQEKQQVRLTSVLHDLGSST